MKAFNNGRVIARIIKAKDVGSVSLNVSHVSPLLSAFRSFVPVAQAIEVRAKMFSDCKEEARANYEKCVLRFKTQLAVPTFCSVPNLW